MQEVWNGMSKPREIAKVLLAEVFYYVNYVNVNYSVKNLTVGCKYLLNLYEFPNVFFKQSAILAFLYTVLVLI